MGICTGEISLSQIIVCTCCKAVLASLDFIITQFSAFVHVFFCMFKVLFHWLFMANPAPEYVHAHFIDVILAKSQKPYDLCEFPKLGVTESGAECRLAPCIPLLVASVLWGTFPGSLLSVTLASLW